MINKVLTIVLIKHIHVETSPPRLTDVDKSWGHGGWIEGSPSLELITRNMYCYYMVSVNHENTAWKILLSLRAMKCFGEIEFWEKIIDPDIIWLSLRTMNLASAEFSSERQLLASIYFYSPSEPWMSAQRNSVLRDNGWSQYNFIVPQNHKSCLREIKLQENRISLNIIWSSLRTVNLACQLSEI